MRFSRFIDSLSFNYKITFGFLTLILIMTLGMSYMLKKYTDMSTMTTDIIDRYHPVTNLTSDALQDIQTADNLLHEYLLNNDLDMVNTYTAIMLHARDDIELLIKYSKDQEISINQDDLKRVISIIDELNTNTSRMVSLGKDFYSNYPIISYATEELNPIGREYLGIINAIIADNKELGLSEDEIIVLTDMRQSWTQMMSNMKVVIATRSQSSVDNVYVYS